MRILLLTVDFPPATGGIQNLLARLASGLAGGHELSVVAPSHPAARAWEAEPPYHVTRAPRMRLWPLVMLSFVCAAALRAIRRPPDVVVCGHALLGPASYLIARLFGVRMVVMAYALEIRAPRMQRLARWTLRHAARVVTISDFTRQAVIAHGVKPDRIVVIHPGAAFVPSMMSRPSEDSNRLQEVGREGGSCPRPAPLVLSAKSTVDGGGASGRAGRPRARPPASAPYNPSTRPLSELPSYRATELPNERTPEPPIILTVARLGELYKGHDMLIRALPLVLAKVPDVQYVIAGDGPLRPYLERLAASVGVADQVTFTGAVSDEELGDWYRRATVFAMLSRESPEDGGAEGYGLAFIEAGAWGKPVVAGKSGGIPDAVIDGVTGLLVPPTDTPAIADALVRVLADPQLAATLGAQGRERALNELSWPNFTAAFERTLAAGVDTAPDLKVGPTEIY